MMKTTIPITMSSPTMAKGIINASEVTLPPGSDSQKFSAS